MRAVRFHEPGTPSVLQVEEIDRPDPDADEILVSVRSVSVNPTDTTTRASDATPVPKTTGSDFAGVVESVGTDVTGFSVGDRVCGTGLHTNRFEQGSFAEYVAVPTDIVTRLPDDVSFTDGAAVALVGVTAWQAFVGYAELDPTERCLVHGGTGGVGHVAVQLADVIGATPVATAHSESHLQAAEKFGADTVVDYRREDLRQRLTKTGGGFDVILDHRVHDYLRLDVESSAFGARIVHIGGEAAELPDSRTCRKHDISIHGLSMSNLVLHPDFPTLDSVLACVLSLVDRKEIVPTIARTYDIEEAAEMHRAVSEDSYVGKLVATL